MGSWPKDLRHPVMAAPGYKRTSGALVKTNPAGFYEYTWQSQPSVVSHPRFEPVWKPLVFGTHLLNHIFDSMSAKGQKRKFSRLALDVCS